jgi:hypothetical protein
MAFKVILEKRSSRTKPGLGVVRLRNAELSVIFAVIIVEKIGSASVVIPHKLHPHPLSSCQYDELKFAPTGPNPFDKNMVLWE